MSPPRSQHHNFLFDSLPNSVLSKDGEVRPALFAALTDLFVSRENPSGEEISRYEDMALRLITDADASARAHAAARLSTHKAAPITVIDALLLADPACATILLEHCARLSPETLLDIASWGIAEEAIALARRKGLPENIAEILSRRIETAVHVALVENRDVVLNPPLFARMMKSARTNDELAAALCKRTFDSRLIAPLFLNASPEQSAEIMRDAEFASFTSAQMKRVETANDTLINWMMERGRKGRWGLVAQEIVRLTGFRRDVVDRMLAHKRGDGLAVLMAAIGCPPAKAIRLFLSCPPAISHSYDRVKSLAHIVEHVPAHAAYRLVHDIMGTPMETAIPKHLALHDPRAAALPGRALSGLSTSKLPAQRQSRTNLRMQR